MAVADVSARSIGELMSLEGRKAVVTGAAKGIGLAIAHRLSEAGAEVMLADVDASGVQTAAKAVAAAHGRRALATDVDVADASSITALADRAARELGGIDIWVNNAGVYPTTPLLDMRDEDWDRVLDINLRGTFVGSREAARHMVNTTHGGVIINIASTAAYQAAGPGVAHYVASKHGVLGLTKSLAVELGPHDIRVLAVSPTLIETPGIEANLELFRSAGLEGVLDQLVAHLPLGRAGVADDVARVVLFCASDLATFMTGSSVLVDAGDIAV